MKYERLEANNYYHIFNQGNNREDIFKETMNYDYFLKLMTRHVVPVARILSYCMLKNHFHLLVQIKDVQEEKKISQSFSNFFNSYAKSINKKYGRTGSLFRDRFKRIKVNNNEYLKTLVAYINLNAVYHGFVDDVYAYKYSSFLSLLSDKDTILEREEVISLFEDRENFKFCIEQKNTTFGNKFKNVLLE